MEEADGYVTIDCKLGTKSFDKQIEEVETRLNEIDDILKDKKELKLSSRDIKELNLEAEKLNNKLTDLNQKKQKLNEQETENFVEWLKQAGKEVKNNIRQLGKWALAIFGIRSAYNTVRSAMSVLSQYNEDLANKIQNIQLIMAVAFEPLIERIVNIVYRLLGYINTISKAWFNIDLFSRANEISLKKGAKSAKEMRKSLSGFDEMNIVQDTTTAGIGETGGTGLTEGQEPKWIKWIAENKDTVLGILKTIGGMIAGIKIVEFIGRFVDLGKVFSNLKDILKPLLSFIGKYAAEIGGILLIAGGVYKTTKGIIDYLKDPSWQNFIDILIGVGMVAGGVLLIFGGFPALITAIIGVVIALGLAIYKNWEDIKKWFANVGDWINKTFIDPIKKAFGKLPNWLQTLIKGMINSVISMLNFLIQQVNNLLLPLRGVVTLVGKVMGKNWSLDTIKIPSIPKLAKGGIVSMPSRGVLTGTALTGEAGTEGVIPLTDSQQMALLGEAIGKYININLTNITKLDNRQIAREQKKINTQNDFAFNR